MEGLSCLKWQRGAFWGVDRPVLRKVHRRLDLEKARALKRCFGVRTWVEAFV